MLFEDEAGACKRDGREEMANCFLLNNSNSIIETKTEFYQKYSI